MHVGVGSVYVGAGEGGGCECMYMCGGGRVVSM